VAGHHEGGSAAKSIMIRTTKEGKYHKKRVEAANSYIAEGYLREKVLLLHPKAECAAAQEASEENVNCLRKHLRRMCTASGRERNKCAQ